MKTKVISVLKNVWSYMSWGFPRFTTNPKSNGTKLDLGYLAGFAMIAWILSVITGLSFWDAVLAWALFYQSPLGGLT